MRKGTAGITAAAGVVGLIGGFALSRLIAKPEADKPTVTVMERKGPQPAKPAAPARPNIGNEIYKVEVGNAPVRGGKAPKVTIVAFSEFQCPFCSRVTPTLDQVQKTYGNEVAIAFKHFPLNFHPNA